MGMLIAPKLLAFLVLLTDTDTRKKIRRRLLGAGRHHRRDDPFGLTAPS
jgi:hypothetical protein